LAGNRYTVIAPDALDGLIDALRRRGYRVVGPVVENGAIVYDDLVAARDLPVGWRDVQDAGTYRLERRDDGARFGFAVGPHSWKRFLFPPRVRLWSAQLGEHPVEDVHEDAPLAFFGIRACELHAIEIQDRVFLRGRYTDSDYAARREGAFFVAVNCFEPGGTCFCSSMGTGPGVESGFDLALTELLDGEHRFLVEIGSDRGAEIVDELEARPPTRVDLDAADRQTEVARERMGRTLDVSDVRDLLLDNLEHPRWDDVAARCLGCTNCTLVCPTCFCSAVEDTSDLAGEEATRTRVWDTCFSLDHSYIHGGSVRESGRSRYRQWLTHKFATWVDQFGTSGCVGCGRCITWCPVGIDVTEEITAIREREAAHV
jgi:ferredoxin